LASQNLNLAILAMANWPKRQWPSLAKQPMTNTADIIAIALPQTLPEIQEVISLPTARALKKKTDQKPGLAEEETGWDDKSTGLLLGFFEDNFILQLSIMKSRKRKTKQEEKHKQNGNGLID
jgi:hypothetical protein